MAEQPDLIEQYRESARACCEDCVRVAEKRIADDPDWVRQTQVLANRVETAERERDEALRERDALLEGRDDGK